MGKKQQPSLDHRLPKRPREGEGGNETRLGAVSRSEMLGPWVPSQPQQKTEAYSLERVKQGHWKWQMAGEWRTGAPSPNQAMK